MLSAGNLQIEMTFKVLQQGLLCGRPSEGEKVLRGGIRRMWRPFDRAVFPGTPSINGVGIVLEVRRLAPAVFG